MQYRRLLQTLAPLLAVLLPIGAMADIIAISDAGRRGQAPDIAVGADGSIHVIWLDKGPLGTADNRGSYSGGGHSHQSFTDLLYSRSDDGGASFSSPVRVNSTDGEVWGFAISKAQVTTGPDNIVHVSYPANAVSSTTGKDVASSAYVRSTDAGETFSKAIMLNSDPEEDLSAIVSGGLAQAQVFGSITASDQGEIYTFWLDTREMDAEKMLSSVYMRVSRDSGENFDAEKRLYLADSCPCCQITSTAAKDGTVFLATRFVSPEHIRSPMISRSTDRGKTFGERVEVSGKPWKIQGCPLKPTALATDGQFLYTLVHNGAEDPPGLVFSRSTDAGASFEAEFKIHPEAGVSNHPVLIATEDQLVALWHAKVDSDRRVYLRTSADRGESFGPVAELAAPEGTAAYPAAAAMPDGSVIVVWQQGEQILSERVEL